jgi:hypothetical protein
MYLIVYLFAVWNISSNLAALPVDLYRHYNKCEVWKFYSFELLWYILSNFVCPVYKYTCMHAHTPTYLCTHTQNSGENTKW